MKAILLAAVAATAIAPIAASAQNAAPLTVFEKNESVSGNAILPAGTEVLLRTSEEVTTKGKAWDEGDSFRLSVARDVMVGDYVVMPAGSPAQGRITWLTSRGAFGKSGKMDIELEHVTVNGRQIPVDGTFRQEGEGATMATVAGVVLAGVFAGFITGKSGRIPEGRELMATTEQPLELAVAADAVKSSTRQVAFAPAATQVEVVEEVVAADEPVAAASE